MDVVWSDIPRNFCKNKSKSLDYGKSKWTKRNVWSLFDFKMFASRSNDPSNSSLQSVIYVSISLITWHNIWYERADGMKENNPPFGRYQFLGWQTKNALIQSLYATVIVHSTFTCQSCKSSVVVLWEKCCTRFS